MFQSIPLPHNIQIIISSYLGYQNPLKITSKALKKIAEQTDKLYSKKHVPLPHIIDIRRNYQTIQYDIADKGSLIFQYIYSAITIVFAQFIPKKKFSKKVFFIPIQKYHDFDDIITKSIVSMCECDTKNNMLSVYHFGGYNILLLCSTVKLGLIINLERCDTNIIRDYNNIPHDTTVVYTIYDENTLKLNDHKYIIHQFHHSFKDGYKILNK